VRPAVEAWASGEAVTLVAGQQVGFGGGPVYTLAKIASLVKMKRELEASGRKAIVFFWLATEDHDFDEVATLTVPVSNRQADLLTLRVSRPPSAEMVGQLPVPESLIRELLALYDLERPQWLREGITFRDSFAELIASVFGDEVVLVDALLPELRRAGAPLFAKINESWSEIERLLAERSRQLADAGYKPQVESRDGRYTLLFRIDPDGTRHALSGPADLEPERISTSALTRPLLQDFVLVPDVFLGGPAEVAYYAQLAPLHELLGIALPRVALRGHTLIAPKRVARALERYAIDPAEVFRNPDAIVADREAENVARIQTLADEARRELFARIEQIGELALPADHAVARSINRSVGHIEYHFDKLAERAVRGMVRKDRDRYAAVREIVATLFPDRNVQDRVVGWLPFWLRHGKPLIDLMIELTEPDSPNFRIITL
jgi:bacillithiol biosynthesis cysteine-adding enzyme BshC